MNEEIWQEFFKQYQNKFKHITEIGRLTRDLGDALSRNDRVSVELLLEMRREEMNGADLCEKNIRILIDSLQGTQRAMAESNFEDGTLDGEEEAVRIWIGKIREIREKTKNILQDTIARDKIMNQKLAGEDSFYFHVQQTK